LLLFENNWKHATIESGQRVVSLVCRSDLLIML